VSVWRTIIKRPAAFIIRPRAPRSNHGNRIPCADICSYLSEPCRELPVARNFAPMMARQVLGWTQGWTEVMSYRNNHASISTRDSSFTVRVYSHPLSHWITKETTPRA
jgi:hypothetical protein